mmetsp:Transcript_4158/g.9439  ORF Transcript_4158/g.9439 Transcript_4158/m.9439 type:complete len:147 (-) Transcript_4158:241-681(-)
MHLCALCAADPTTPEFFGQIVSKRIMGFWILHVLRHACHSRSKEGPDSTIRRLRNQTKKGSVVAAVASNFGLVVIPIAVILPPRLVFVNPCFLALLDSALDANIMTVPGGGDWGRKKVRTSGENSRNGTPKNVSGQPYHVGASLSQ